MKMKKEANFVWKRPNLASVIGIIFGNFKYRISVSVWENLGKSQYISVYLGIFGYRTGLLLVAYYDRY